MKEKGTLFLSSKKYSNDLSIYEVVKKFCKNKYIKKIVLKYSSKMPGWTSPGQKSSKLVNDGNGYNFISYDVNGKEECNYRLDYFQASNLRALLKLADDESATFKYYKE